MTMNSMMLSLYPFLVDVVVSTASRLVAREAFPWRSVFEFEKRYVREPLFANIVLYEMKIRKHALALNVSWFNFYFRSKPFLSLLISYNFFKVLIYLFYIQDGEELYLIEMDQGDGWTRVRRIQPETGDMMPEGFVPTSYIEIYDKFAQPQPV